MTKYVLIETMPDHLRGSHRTALGGRYPGNGAERSVVDAGSVDATEAGAIIRDDEPDEYDVVLREATVDDVTEHCDRGELLAVGLRVLDEASDETVVEDGDSYIYRAPETGERYRVTTDDVIDLGAAMKLGVRDAYSHWCTGCGEEVR